jgi:hypothetical protein
LRLPIADDLLLGSIQGRQQVRSIVLGLDQVALQLVDPGVPFPARTRIADIVAQRHAGDQFLSAKGTEASAGILGRNRRLAAWLRLASESFRLSLASAER